jgi:hypothetical protein
MCDKPRLLTPISACVIDGVTDPGELEFHNIGGVRIALCHRCYRKLVERSRAGPPKIWEPPDELERVGHALIAEADFLVMLAQERRQFGHMLIDRVRREAPIETSAPDPANQSVQDT